MNDPTLLKTYEPGREIHSDSLATTLEAVNLEGERVWMHLLHPHLEDDPVILQSFLSEYRGYMGLNHPGLPRAIQVFTDPPAVVTEAPHCSTLMANPPRTFAQVLEFTRSLAGILEYAHSQGVVFRDLNPASLGIREDFSCVIPDGPRNRVRDLLGLSCTTMVGLSIDYLAPEVLFGDNCEPRSDLFSLGRIMQHLISGQPGIPAPRWFSDLTADLTAELPRRVHSASQVLELLIAESPFESEPLIPCIFCLEEYPAVLPLCPSCGKEPLDIQQYYSKSEGEALVVVSLSEKEEILAPFMKRIKALSGDPGFSAEFLTGDLRMYGKEEKAKGIRLPAIILDRLNERDIRLLIDILEMGKKSEMHLERYPVHKQHRIKSEAVIPQYSRRILNPEVVEMARSIIQAEPSKSASRESELTQGGRQDTGETTGLLLRIMGRLPAEVWDSQAILDIRNRIQTIEKELATIDGVLKKLNLGDIYNRIHSLNRRIAKESDHGEAGQLIQEKLLLVDSFARFRQAEVRKTQLRNELAQIEQSALSDHGSPIGREPVGGSRATRI